MVLRIFKGTGPGVIFLIIVTLLAIWMRAFINPPLPGEFNYETLPMPLYDLLKNIIGDNSFLGVLFSFAMISILSFLLVSFNTSFLFIT